MTRKDSLSLGLRADTLGIAAVGAIALVIGLQLLSQPGTIVAAEGNPLSQPISAPVSGPVVEPPRPGRPTMPVSRPVTPPVSRPVTPISHPVIPPVPRPVTKPVSHPVTQPISRPVSPPVVSQLKRINISPRRLNQTMGQTRELRTQLFDQNRRPMTGIELLWLSENESVATVSPEGVVSAVGAGQTTVLAIDPVSGISGEASVRVSAPRGRR